MHDIFNTFRENMLDKCCLLEPYFSLENAPLEQYCVFHMYPFKVEMRAQKLGEVLL